HGRAGVRKGGAPVLGRSHLRRGLFTRCGWGTPSSRVRSERDVHECGLRRMTAAASGSGGRLLDRPRLQEAVPGEETLDGGSGLVETHVTRGHSVETLISPPDLFDGAYELIDLMGQGAMGEVWRARNVNLDKEVA